MKLLLILFFMSFQVHAHVASWYGPGFHGKRTASGSIFNQWSFTAAHKRYPFGSKVKVTNLKNHKSVIVTISDRGPNKRDIDLSRGAARRIGLIGIEKVKIARLK